MTNDTFQGKTALILGCGYVGCATGRALADAGAKITALTRNADRAAEAESFAEKVIQTDLDSADWHNQIEPTQDFVLDCVSSAGGGLDGYHKSYIGGMESILHWAANGQLGTFVYTSATSVYPQSDGQVVTEDDVPAELSASGALLRQTEQLVEKEQSAWRRAFVLRLGAIYGPERHYLLDALKRGQTTFPGEGDFILNYIHLDDIVSAILAAFASNRPGGTYNLVDGAHPTKRDVVEWLAEQIGAEKPVFDPSQQSRRAGVRTNAQGKLPHRKVSNEKLRRELGWAPKFADFKAGYSGLL